MVNDRSLVQASLEPLARALGDDNLIDSGSTPYFGEDFAFFQQHIPGAMYWLGVSNTAAGTVGMPHSPNYVADEGAILVGADGKVYWSHLGALDREELLRQVQLLR